MVAPADRFALRPALLDRADRAVGLLPGLPFRRGDDRAERHLDARHVGAARLPCSGLDRVDLLGGPGQRLAPQAVDVGLGAPGGVRGGRGTAERDVGARLLDGEDIADEIVEAVVLALVVEGPAGRPDLLDDLDVLAGAGVALVLGEGVALAALLVVVAAGDEVDGQPALADLVEGGEGLGGEGGIGHVRPVGQQDLQALQPARDVRGGGCGVRGAGAVGEQHPVPAVLLVGGGEAERVLLVEGGAGARGGFGAVVGGGDPEELHGHDGGLSRVTACGAWRTGPADRSGDGASER